MGLQRGSRELWEWRWLIEPRPVGEVEQEAAAQLLAPALFRGEGHDLPGEMQDRRVVACTVRQHSACLLTRQQLPQEQGLEGFP